VLSIRCGDNQISVGYADPDLPLTAMKPEYDFSKGERGKFFRPGARLNIPSAQDKVDPDEILPEYDFSRAEPNKFASRCSTGSELEEVKPSASPLSNKNSSYDKVR